MSINHGAVLGCEIKRSEHAPGEASVYLTLVKFEQSVVLSLARTTTPDSQLSWSELAERREANKRSFFKTRSLMANQEKFLCFLSARIIHAAECGPGS